MMNTDNKALSTINETIEHFFTKRRCVIVASALIAIYILIFSIICIRRYVTFEYHDWDFAIYINMLWNLIHGKPYSSLLHCHILKDHASIIAYVIAIPYFIFRDPRFLLILQSFAIGITCIPIYMVAKNRLGNASAVALTLLYLCYPAVHYLNLYEFYFETFSIPFIAFSFYFLLANRKILYFLMCIGACACKENIPLMIAALGLFGLTRPKRRILGFATIILGVAWFIFDIKIIPMVLTHITGEKVTGLGAFGPHSDLFIKYGQNLNEVFSYMLFHPFEILKAMFDTQQKVTFFYHLLTPLLFLPLLRPDILLIALPNIISRLLGANTSEYTIFYHAGGPNIPIIFFALIFAINTLYKKVPKIAAYRYVLLISLFVTEIIFLCCIWEGRPELVKFNLRDKDVIRSDFVKSIPKDASVAASLEFLPQLANREHIYAAHVFFGRKTWWKKYPPKDLEYILVDVKSPVLMGTWYESVTLFDKDLYPYLLDNNFGIVKARKDILLFKKDYTSDDMLLFTDKGPDSLPADHVLNVDNSIALLKYNYKLLPEDNNILQLTFYWYKETENPADYMVRLFVTQGDYDILYAVHPLGYAMLPPSLWSKGDIVRENYWFVLPPVYSGKHIISIQLMNTQKDKETQLSSPDKERVDQNGKYKLLTLTQ